jgi:hypothetical protein
MKKIFLLTSFCFAYLLSHAQEVKSDSWTIKLNKKVILDAFKYNETANTRTIKLSDLAKNGFLEIIYHSADTAQAKAWKRSFLFMDENDKELLRKDSTINVKISDTQLKKLLGDKKKISIYTIALPMNLEMAARIRVRRLHLCTLIIQ